MDGIIVKNVVKRYASHSRGGIDVLNGINFTLQGGEFVGLVGDSGCGKSTLARLLIGIDQPSGGEIIIDGVSVNDMNYRQWQNLREKIQGVFQDAAGTLNPAMSVMQNMSEALRNIKKMPPYKCKETLLSFMQALSLDEKILTVPARRLSGGQQRRVALIRALAIRPQYLVLDEITNGLDLLARDSVLKTLETYRSNHGFTCLFITHDMDAAYRICDRILKIEDGLIINQLKKMEVVYDEKN